jgi:hypothetical protein
VAKNDRTPPDDTKWPVNSDSNIVDAYPRWRSVTDWDMPVNKLRQVHPSSLRDLTEMTHRCNLCDQPSRLFFFGTHFCSMCAWRIFK